MSRYLPSIPNCVSRLTLTWDHTYYIINVFLEEHPLPPQLCRGCFIIFIQSLFKYLLSDTVLMKEEHFIEIKDIYQQHCLSFLNGKKQSQERVFAIFDFEIALHDFAQNHFACVNRDIYNNIQSICKYQKSIWMFCEQPIKSTSSPVPFH